MTDIKIKLGDRMKQYEEEYDIKIPLSHYFIVRLDGKNFSKYTRRLQKNKHGHSVDFATAMIYTMNDLVSKYNALTGYTHSDEITLIFGKCEENQTHFYGGRIQKICSIIASDCSIYFNKYMSNLSLSSLSDGIFDARIMSFPEEKKYEILNHMIWRSIHDCERNAISVYARAYYSKKSLHKKNSTDMKLLLKEKGVDWEDVEMSIKHGTYAKKERYETTMYVEYHKKEMLVTRHKIVNRSFKIYSSEEDMRFLFSKYIKDCLR